MGTKVQAFMLDIGDRFVWKNKTYTIVRDYDHKRDQDALVVTEHGVDGEQQFNPYCEVERA